MRVLGIDPGLTRCGLGVVEGRAGRRVDLVAVDVIRTPSQDPLAQRLLGISESVEGWIGQTRPDVLVVEQVFSQQNVRTVMGTAQAAGVALLAAARHGVPVAIHTPSEVKAAITGSGRAGKDQVASMVTRILDLPARPRPADAADALAIAICHLWRGSSSVQAGDVVTAAQQRWVDAETKARRTGAARVASWGRRRPDASATRQQDVDGSLT
jgi:crossover junction endodeoxyribonuclease RuvC